MDPQLILNSACSSFTPTRVSSCTSAKKGDRGKVTLLWGRPHVFFVYPGDFSPLVSVSQTQKC